MQGFEFVLVRITAAIGMQVGHPAPVGQPQDVHGTVGADAKLTVKDEEVGMVNHRSVQPSVDSRARKRKQPQAGTPRANDRKSGAWGTSVSVGGDLGGSATL